MYCGALDLQLHIIIFTILFNSTEFKSIFCQFILKVAGQNRPNVQVKENSPLSR